LNRLDVTQHEACNRIYCTFHTNAVIRINSPQISVDRLSDGQPAFQNGRVNIFDRCFFNPKNHLAPRPFSTPAAHIQLCAMIFCKRVSKLKAGLMRKASMLLAVLALSASTSYAQDVAEFYKGKTIRLLIGYSAGGVYDLYARLLARHMGRHIPGSPI